LIDPPDGNYFLFNRRYRLSGYENKNAASPAGFPPRARAALRFLSGRIAEERIGSLMRASEQEASGQSEIHVLP